MTATTVQQLETFGPERCETLTPEQARQWCRKLANERYENFSVVSAMVPAELREDFAAVYAFCRWADDLGDEISNRERSLELLAWWRRELEQCFAGSPRHPVFLALGPTIKRHDLPMQPFDDLIRAFEQDQRVDRYRNWEEVLGYCRLSADPVGRLVLMVCGEARSEKLFRLSDRICTALQLTNHWQDVRRDIVDRDRIYIPRDLMKTPGFEQRLIATAKQGYGVDHQILEESRQVVRTCVDRTWPLFEQGAELLNHVRPRTRPVIGLFLAGGQHVLRKIQMWNCETAVHRPSLGRVRKAMLVAGAWMGARRAARRAGGGA